MSDSIPRQLRQAWGAEESLSPVGEDEAGLPPQASGDYRAYGRASTKPLISLHFITPDGQVRSFQYRHLDSDTSFEHRFLTLRFVALMPTLVVIEGRNLWQLYDCLHQNRVPWVKQAARDFAEHGEPIVSKLTFIELSNVPG